MEEPDVQVQVQTQSIGFGGQRESGGQDPSVIDLKDELQQEKISNSHSRLTLGQGLSGLGPQSRIPGR